MSNPTFLIISVNDSGSHNGPTYSEIARITSKSIIEYSQVHGYYYAIHDTDLDISRPASWSKPYLTRKYLEDGYNFILNWDSDVMVINQNIKLENFVDHEHDVFITCYQNNIDHLNTGAIIYRNSPFTRDLLGEIYDSSKYPIAGPNVFYEQSALISYYKNHPEKQSRFKMIPVRSINSHFHAGFNDPKWNVNYVHGEDLCVHAAGTDNNFRYETFKELGNWIIKPGEPIKEGFNVPFWNR